MYASGTELVNRRQLVQANRNNVPIQVTGHCQTMKANVKRSLTTGFASKYANRPQRVPGRNHHTRIRAFGLFPTKPARSQRIRIERTELLALHTSDEQRAFALGKRLHGPLGYNIGREYQIPAHAPEVGYMGTFVMPRHALTS